MKNRVARLVDIGRIEIEEEPMPNIFSIDNGYINEYVTVKLTSVGICGSDLHYFKEGGLGSFKNPMPMDIGHEPAGIIYESTIPELPIGTRVALEPGHVCGHCKFCLHGKHNLCSNVTFMGANSDGAFRDYIIVHKSQCYPIPNNLMWSSNDRIALLEPLGVAAHTINRLNPKAFSDFIIFGAGPIGLCIADSLAIAGHNIVGIVEPLKYRRDFVEKYSYGPTFTDDDITDANVTADYVIDAAGFQSVIDKCYSVVNPGGKVALVGIPEVDNLKYNPHKMRIKEVDIVNVRRSNQTLDTVISVYDRWATSIDDIVTHTFDLQDIQTAFETAANYSDKIIKGMIYVSS